MRKSNGGGGRKPSGKAKMSEEDKILLMLANFADAVKQLEQQAEITIRRLKEIRGIANKVLKYAKKQADKELHADAKGMQMRATRRMGQMLFGGPA